MFWIVVCIFFIYVGFYVYHNKIAFYVEDRNNSGTLHEFISNNYHNVTGSDVTIQVRLVASLATITCLLIALTLELHLAALLVSRLLSLELSIAFMGLAALVAAYAAVGGFRAVVITDIFQSSFLALAIVLFFIVAYLNADSPPVTPYGDAFGGAGHFFKGAGWYNALSIVVIGFGWFLVTMDTWQRNCAARSIDKSLKGAMIGCGLMVLAVVMWTYVGIYDRLAIFPSLEGAALQAHSGGYNPFLDFFYFMPLEQGIWKLFGGLIALALVLAGLSTTDTFLTVCGHSLVSDILIGVKKRSSFGDLTPEQSLAFTTLGRAIIVGMGIAVIIVWFIFAHLQILYDPLTLFFVAYSVQYALLCPVIFAMRRNKLPAKAAMWSIGLGILTSLFFGLGSAIRLAAGGGPIMGFAPEVWLALTPVMTVIVGGLVLLLAGLKATAAE
jgi:Na+/proline symporter